MKMGSCKVSFAFLLLCHNQQHAFVVEEATACKRGLSITTKVRDLDARTLVCRRIAFQEAFSYGASSLIKAGFGLPQPVTRS